MTVSIEPATVDDGPAILQLLSRIELHVAGLLEHLDTAVVVRTDGRIVGCAALELYPDGALLRSVAVDAAARGGGLGSQLTRSALDLACRVGSPAVYLLTTTAVHFFPRFGFDRIERSQVPALVQQSVEFCSACPASATAMWKNLAVKAVRRPLGRRE